MLWDKHVRALELRRQGGKGRDIHELTKIYILLMYSSQWTWEGKAHPIHGILGDVPSVSARCKKISSLWRLDWTFIYNLVMHFTDTGEVKSRMERRVEPPPSPILQTILNMLVDFATGKTHVPVTLEGLVTRVVERHNLKISDKRMSAIAEELGYSYGKVTKKKGPSGPITAQSITKTWHKLIYIAKLGHFLKLSREGKAVIGWQDETFVHFSLNSEYGFVPSDGSGVVGQSPSKGRLLSVSHVLTSSGLLQDYRTDGTRYTPDLSEAWSPVPTAEQILLPAKPNADYHEFEGGTFKTMMANRILLAAKAAHPECFGPDATSTFVLHIDNAPSHHSPGDVEQIPTGKTKLLDFADRLKIKHSWFWRLNADGSQTKVSVTFNAALRKTSSIKEPDLRAAVINWASEHAPQYLMCEVEAFAEKEGFVILWGVPNEPDWNPIEMVWSILKAYVALKYKPRRKQAELLAQIREALYSTAYAAEGQSKVKGGGFIVPPGSDTCPLAERLIRHSLDCIDKWIAEVCPTAKPGEGETAAPWLSGSVQGDLFVHPDLVTVAAGLQTRKQILRWITDRVLLDERRLIAEDDIEDEATE
jgi:transposase